jgi:hypothetical protein
MSEAYFLFAYYDGDSPELYGPLSKKKLEKKLSELFKAVDGDEVELNQVESEYLGDEGYFFDDGDFVVIKGCPVETEVVKTVKLKE